MFLKYTSHRSISLEF